VLGPILCVIRDLYKGKQNEIYFNAIYHTIYISNSILLILKIKGYFEFENYHRIIIPPVFFILTASFRNTFFNRKSYYYRRIKSMIETPEIKK